MVEISKNKMKYFYQQAFRKRNIFLFIFSLILAGCANQLPPGGGDVDRTPPKIVDVFPANGTTNFNEDYFEIEFSEYVDKRSLQDAIFISPSIDGPLDLNWSGKSVRVNFPNMLKENTTYVINIGTDVVDYNNKNRMTQSFIFTFSTGNEIDKRVVTGNIYSEKPDGVLIFAYKLPAINSAINFDTLNVLKNKPDFISQTGKNGSFKLMGLAEGEYRVFAVKDEFHDLLYQPDQDMIGIPFTDINFSESDTLFNGLNFFLTKVDTTKPRLLSANMTDQNHILINFSEEIDSTIIHPSNFFLFDSTAGKKVNLIYAFKGTSKPTEMVLITKEKFPLSNEVFLFADTIKDKQGNIYLADHTSINLSDKPDTVKPGITKIEPNARTEGVDFINTNFTFYFNDAFSLQTVKKAIIFSDTLGNKIPNKISFLDDASFNIKSEKKLEPDKDYFISLDLSKFKDVAGNSIDSVYKYKFKTISGLDFTGVIGQILNVNYKKNPILILQGMDKDKLIYKKKVDGNPKFGFDRIVPGKYLLWCFLDEDSSGSYSYGNPFPYKPSEEFSFYKDTLNLRARWTQTDLNFIFK